MKRHPKTAILTAVSALLAIVSITVSGTTLSAQDVSASLYTPEELQKHFQNEAEAYEMRQGDTMFVLRKQPLMHWQNSARNQELGATYIWEHNGRPQVLASIFTYEWNNVVHCRHEMISLAADAFSCKLRSEEVWSPSRTGLKWSPIPGNAMPASSAARRMFQMRTIARQFSGKLIRNQKPPARLALIPQPLVRYQPTDESAIDGAIFSFAVATDPELLLVIEAVQSEGDTTQFRFATVRSNYSALELSLSDEKVWEAPFVKELQRTKAGQRPWSNDPFFVFTPAQKLPQPGTIQ